MAPNILELPAFLGGAKSEPPILAASRAVVSLFLSEGSSEFSVKQLAAHAGLAERTFYRYFPRKEDAIRPYVEAALAEVVARLRDTPAEVPLREAIVASQGAIFDLARSLEVRRLLDVLTGTERLRAVWLKLLTDAELAFAEVVAERVGVRADSTRARFAGASIVTAGRLALEAWDRRPSEVFVECLGLVDPNLFCEEMK